MSWHNWLPLTEDHHRVLAVLAYLKSRALERMTGANRTHGRFCVTLATASTPTPVEEDRTAEQRMTCGCGDRILKQTEFSMSPPLTIYNAIYAEMVRPPDAVDDGPIARHNRTHVR